MTTIAADQAKNEFETLLSRAAAGEEFLITQPGVPAVRIGPAPAQETTATTAIASAIAKIRELRQGNRLGPDLTVRQLINEGRRF